MVPPNHYDVLADRSDFAIYPYGAELVFEGKKHFQRGRLNIPVYKPAERLLATAELEKGGQGQLRLGWLWFAGTTMVAGAKRTVCFPALSAPVQRVSNFIIGESGLAQIGDAEISPLITDPDLRRQLLDGAQFGGGVLSESKRVIDPVGTEQWVLVDPDLVARLNWLKDWAAKIAQEVGIETGELDVAYHENPAEVKHRNGSLVSAFACFGLYFESGPKYSSSRESLEQLACLDDLSSTAMGPLFGNQVQFEERSYVHELGQFSARQRAALERIKASSLSVLSGPPGTGKTHLLAVSAQDAVAWGRSVLVVTNSKHATDVLVEYLEDTPGPTPVVFDGSARAKELAFKLIERAGETKKDTSQAEAEIARATELEAQFTSVFDALNTRPSNDVEPGPTPATAEELDELGRLIEEREQLGAMQFLRAKRVEAELKKRLGEGDAKTLLQKRRRALETAQMLRDGPSGVSDLLDQIHLADTTLAEAFGESFSALWLNPLSHRQRALLREIGYALSSTRQERAESFTNADPNDLTSAAPLWVGTLEDVDRFLPAVPGLFDVVIFDEAAQISPIEAGVGLVRGKSAIVCGDPIQLGHSSFLSNDEIMNVARQHGLDAEVINPNRNSLFDLAVAKVPVTVLDEHYRSDPHLIEFSSRRFYNGSLQVMTRHPRNDAADHIDVRVVDGARDGEKVNAAEVAECLRVVEEFAQQGWTSIGLVSPFRAQADALEAALLKKYRLAEIDTLGLRVGTAHAFQGDERRLMIASLAIGPDEEPRAWQFVNQPNLFNVMVTRAREHMIVVTSDPSPPGLAGDYIEWSEPFEGLIADAPTGDAWIAQLVDQFESAGVATRTGYRVGHHIIDLVAGPPEHALALDCLPHPDGAAAHLDRALHLRRMGWNTADAFEVEWRNNTAGLVVDLLRRFSDLKAIAP